MIGLDTLAWSPFDPWHMLVLGVVALLLFGKRLPEVGRSLGRGIAEFKKGLHDVQDELNRDAGTDEEPPKHRLEPPRTEDEPIETQDAPADESTQPAEGGEQQRERQ